MHQNIEYILTIYETGSIRKAAEQLHITQPALSIALRKAEESLGSPLFDRSCHPLELTPAGKIYLDGIYQMRQIEKNIKTAIQDLSALNTGSLLIGGTQYFISYVLPPVIRRYMQLYPGVKLQLSEANAPLNIKKLLSHQIDLMLSTREYDPDRFEIYPISHSTLFLSVPLDLARESKVMPWALDRTDILSGACLSAEPIPEPARLSGLPFILLPPGSGLQKRSRKFFENAGFAPKIALCAEQLVTAYHLSCCQIGAAFVTDTLIRQSAAADVIYLKLDPALAIRGFHIVTRKNHYLSNAARKFIALCKEELIPADAAPGLSGQ